MPLQLYICTLAYATAQFGIVAAGNPFSVFWMAASLIKIPYIACTAAIDRCSDPITVELNPHTHTHHSYMCVNYCAKKCCILFCAVWVWNKIACNYFNTPLRAVGRKGGEGEVGCSQPLNSANKPQLVCGSSEHSWHPLSAILNNHDHCHQLTIIRFTDSIYEFSGLLLLMIY